ncbi:MAG: tRNA (adenosine(37)-N6)-threonylcarbamoyltransferase complex transferase subunit TsaD [Flavobacteriales bacterium]|nr:tRNA (adenosine(37)-N6)-threonylcarbamoyltransferase complex transferase subunit TsaD [Flavobacteriales bacterium]
MSSGKPLIILGIESSCDETAAAVLVDGRVRSNVIASQDVHKRWGGVVPELASRAHQEHIVPVVSEALRQADMAKEDITAIAFTQGPGLIGALLVGACYARSMAQALEVPLIAVDHIKAHVLAHFIQDHEERSAPQFPFINLTVSGGHTQLILVRSALDMEVIGTTLDDAAGEAFDKGAKILGLPYPGGPLVDAHAVAGDPTRHTLPRTDPPDLAMSFSGVKSAFMALVRKGSAGNPDFIERELPHLCAALQATIIDQLLMKLKRATEEHAIISVGLSGGVSANSELRKRAALRADREGWDLHLPPFAYCTDNAAMIAMAGQFLHLAGEHAGLDTVPVARW